VQTASRPRALLLAALVAAAVGGGFLAAPSASADTTTTTAITGTPPRATYGTWYSFTFGVQGFSAPVDFSLDEGSTLPAGLDLYSGGQIAGSPGALDPGTPVVLRASDGGVDPDATLTVTIPVDNRAPQWSATPAETTTIPAGQHYYVIYRTAFNLVRPTFLASGGLPPGLTLNEAGELEGTPTTPGTYTFTVVATNGTAPDAQATRTFVVTGSAPSISGDAPDTVQGAWYDFAYTLGGLPEPDVSVIDGQLPPGLGWGENGRLVGNVETPGTYEFTIAADSVVGRDTVHETITVTPASVSIGGTPPVARVGQDYDFTFGWEAPSALSWDVTTGTLPDGLWLFDGELYGTPTTAGTYRFTVTASDFYGNSASQPVTLKVLPKSLPTISVASSSLREGDSGTRALTFTVSLGGPSTTSVTVHWATANGTAKAGSDYVARSGSLTFAPGQTTKTVTVLVKGDRTKEPTETFTVRLTKPVHATLGQAVATGTIVNDD
jgi:hypothetical protein